MKPQGYSSGGEVLERSATENHRESIAELNEKRSKLSAESRQVDSLIIEVEAKAKILQSQTSDEQCGELFQELDSLKDLHKRIKSLVLEIRQKQATDC